jgi:hypothetical protein
VSVRQPANKMLNYDATRVSCVRGGAANADVVPLSEDESESDLEDMLDFDEELYDDVDTDEEKEKLMAGIAESNGDADEEAEDETEDEDDDDEEEENMQVDVDESPSEDATEEEEEEAPSPALPTSTSASLGPLKVTIKTGLNSPLVDQVWESTCSRTRTVLSVKQSLARQMKGRPPVETQTLLLHGVEVLDDDAILGDIAAEEEDDEDDDDEDDEDKDSDGMVKLQLTLDMPPPIDAKFATEYGELLSKLSKKELLEAYAANMAAMNHVSDAILEEASPAPAAVDDGEVSDDDEDDNDQTDNFVTTAATTGERATLKMRKQALLIQEQLLLTMPENVQTVIRTDPRSQTEEDEEAKTQLAARKLGIQGGASMNVKRMVQHNMNIQWADTVRNALLFLFFGYFGARDPLSKMCMLAMAPLCFVMQARPAKVAMKQLFYAIGKPPGIFLSLLPAPQQAIMDLDFNTAMTDLYGARYSAGRKNHQAKTSTLSKEEEEQDMAEADLSVEEYLRESYDDDTESDYLSSEDDDVISDGQYD